MIELIEPTKVLVDTNVFIYAADKKAGDKNTRASELLDNLVRDDRLDVSVQVLNEFYHASTRPNKPPSLSHEEAGKIIQDLVDFANVLPLSGATTLLALAAIPKYSFSFWDALIWAVAKENEIARVYTEDFQHGRNVEGVLIVNPFASDLHGIAL
jgi:predicted nucleic acid-binding protein